MQLSPESQKAIAILRRRQNQWLYQRWIMLIGGVSCIVLGLWVGIQQIKQIAELSQAAKEMPGFVILLASAATATIVESKLVAVLGVLIAVRAAVHWKGEPSEIVLLAILGDIERQSKTGAA